MHELSIARALLNQVEAVMDRERAAAVAGITLRIGPLSGVEPALLRSAYTQLCKDSMAEGAELSIIMIPVCIYCEACRTEGEVFPNRLICPHCGSVNTLLLCGDDMLLESVDLVF